MYKPTLFFKRTKEEKADPLLSWNRSDKAFFAAGACHILAYSFLRQHPNENFQIIHIKPKANLSGNHVYATNGEWAFDYHGWTKESELLQKTKGAYSNTYPDWDFQRIVVTDDLASFCQKNNHRLPEQFPFLPWERALQYISTFPAFPPTLEKMDI